MSDVTNADGLVACWACAEPVRPDARKCRWCGEWFDELVQRRGTGTVTAVTVDEVLATYSDARRMPESDPVGEADVRLLKLDTLVLEVGADIAERAQGADQLVEAIDAARREIAADFGVIVPAVHVRGADLASSSYVIRIKGDVVAEGTVATSDADEELARAVGAAVRANLSELLDREMVAELLNVARQQAPMVVQELVPNMLSLGQLRQVLQNLVKEQVPIRDLSTILNALADNAVYTKDPNALTEHVRTALGRKLCARYQSPDGTLKAFMLSSDAERAIQNAIQLNETGQVLMLDPNTSKAIHDSMLSALPDHPDIRDPLLITPPKIRRHVKRLLERNFPDIVVMSYSEIVPGMQIDNLETIEAHGQGGTHVAQTAATAGLASGGDWLIGDDADPTSAISDAGDWNW